jgi:hypothetical protein
VARRIEREIKRKAPPRKGVHEKRHPWAAQKPASVRTDEFHVQFGMINVPDFKWPVTMAGSRWI